MPGEVKNQLKSLQLTTISMRKYFEAFQDFIESLNFKFSAIYLSETRLQPHEISDSNFQVPGYYSYHLTREKNRGGALVFVYRS